MKKLFRYSVLTIMVLAVIALSGCEKNDTDNGTDKYALLTANIWNFDKLSTRSTNSDIHLLVDLTATLFTDATLKFNANGHYTLTIMGIAGNGTWELNNDETKLILDKGTENEATHNLAKLTSDILEYNESVVEEGIGNFELTYRWVK
jgi:hypothetical protein